MMDKHTLEKKAVDVRLEFIAMMALIMSIGAFATDSLLPALGVIGKTFGIEHASEKQLLITMIFLGVGIGQLFAGALSDSWGRKPVMYTGFAIFIAASLLSVMTQQYEVLIVSRILQGVGISGPRTVSTAIIRDSYSGSHMAKVMSFIAMVFVFVPAIAPSLGTILLDHLGWQAIFYAQVLVALCAVSWFGLRQPETLAPEDREKLSMSMFFHSCKTFWAEKMSIAYTLLLGTTTGAFLTFLSTSETIFIGQYHKKEEFAYLFAFVALAMGCSMYFNGKYVERYGIRRLVTMASLFFTLIPGVYIVLFFRVGNPPILVFVVFLMAQIFSLGFIFGNLTTLAIEPLGHIAGTASALIGFVSTVIGVAFAGVMGLYFKTTALPLFIAFFISGMLLLLCLSRSRSHENGSLRGVLRDELRD